MPATEASDIDLMLLFRMNWNGAGGLKTGESSGLGFALIIHQDILQFFGVLALPKSLRSNSWRATVPLINLTGP
jgi:hypothetical protein